MTPDEMVSLASTLPLHDHQRVMVRVTTEYHKRVRKHREQQAAEFLGCDHVWETSSHSDRGETVQRCVVCRRERSVYSDD